MSGLIDTLLVARSGVLTQQERVAVTSDNIANVDTDGYHRRITSLTTNPATPPETGEIRNYSTGTGVKVADVVRTFDRMKEMLLLDQTSSTKYHEEKASALNDLESMLNGTGDASLQDHLQSFWNAWQDVANSPDNVGVRSVLIEDSRALVEQIATLADRLNLYRTAIADGGTGPVFSGEIASEVDDINTMTTQLQELNRRITLARIGYEPLDLLDRRDVLIRELSENIGITVSTDYTITVDDQLLVSGDGATRNELSLTNAGTGITLALDGAAVTPGGGSTAAWIDTAAIVEALATELDTLADSLITEVNSLHTAGYDLNGAQGLEFFAGTDSDGDGIIDAESMSMNPLIYDSSTALGGNPALVAAATTLYDAGPPAIPNTGDGSNALRIADLAYATVAALGDDTMNSFFSNSIASLGSIIASEQDLASDGNAVVSMMLDAIQAETGVNLDQEMVDLISAQRAYEAAARVMVSVDEMIETVLRL